MATAYGWRGSRDTSVNTSRSSGPDQMGWWAGVAFLTAIVLHVVAFFALGRIQIALGLKEPKELQTSQVKVAQVDATPEEYRPEPKVQEAPQPPKVNSLVEEIDVLSKLQDPEVDMKPQVKRPEIAMSLNAPAASGAPEGGSSKIDPMAGIKLDTDLPTIGRTPEAPLSIAAEGQITIDPGKSLGGADSIDKFTEDIIKKGAGGRAEKGTLDGVVSLDDMLGLPANVLVGKKTMLPGDLLFEYNSSELRESARVGLMKLALLISNNPNLYCWIEGYTDLYGGDAFNQDLSLRRADSVRRYLVSTLRLPSDRIISRGFGKGQPLIRQGTVDEQAPNRRVEIKMRRTAPPPQQQQVLQSPPPPKEASKPDEAPPAARPVVEDPPQKNPVLVRPKKAIPVEEVPEETAPPPKAKVIADPQPANPQPTNPPKAKVVAPDPEPEPPKARPVTQPAPPRAQPVKDEEESAPAKAIPVKPEAGDE